MTMSSTISPSTATTSRRRRTPQQVTEAHALEADPAPLEPAPDQRQVWLTHGQKPIAFSDAVDLVLAERTADGERADQLADLRGWGFWSRDGKTMEIAQAVSFDGRREEPIALRRMAFKQLCDLANVPADFIARLPPKLQLVNMNHAMSRAAAGPRLMRRAGGELRAIVSDRYAAFDDDVLLEIVDDVLTQSGYRADAMVRASVTGPHMTLRISVPNDGIEVRRGDVIEWGLDVGNSELGLRSVQVVPMTYRLVCLNGMRHADAGATTRLRHVGDPIKIRDDLAVAIPAAFAEARGDLAMWRKSVDTMVDDALGDLEAMFGRRAPGELRAVGRQLAALPEQTTNEELAEHLRGMRTTAFDVANAITATARDRSDVAARMTLEETGHRYLASRTA